MLNNADFESLFLACSSFQVTKFRQPRVPLWKYQYRHSGLKQGILHNSDVVRNVSRIYVKINPLAAYAVRKLESELCIVAIIRQ